MSHEITVVIDDLELTVEITNLVNDSPDPTCRDSDVDFHGERYVEFRVVYGIEHNENGRVIQCGELPWWLNKLQNEHHDAIEAEIWKQYEARDEQ